MHSLKYIIADAVWLVMIFFVTRGFMAVLVQYLLNTSNRKKRRKGQSFLEWFKYERYKDILPKRFLIWYYSNFIIYFIVVAIMIVLDVLKIDEYFMGLTSAVYMIALATTPFITHLKWIDNKTKDYDPSRTINRTKRNK